MKLDLANILLTLCVFVQYDARAAEAQSVTQKKLADNVVVLKGCVIDDQVVDERRKTVAGATVRAMYASKVDYESTPENVITASDCTFELPRKALPLYLKATTPDEKQAGIVRVEADQQQVMIRVSRLAKVTGRVVDWTGKPVQLGHIATASPVVIQIARRRFLCLQPAMRSSIPREVSRSMVWCRASTI